MLKLKSFFFTFFLIFSFVRLTAQSTIGLPEIVNFNKQKYGAGSQNWDIRQDKEGLMYFANNEGLLSFDGTYWRVYPLPNKTIVRSIEIGEDGKIYTGGQDEIGYYWPNKNGRLSYTSLKDLIPEKNRSFTDVWDIYIYKNDVFFRTNSVIFQLSQDKIIAHEAPSEWLFMGLGGPFLLAQDNNSGLMHFQNGHWLPLLDKSVIQFLITSTISLSQDSILLTSSRNGLWILHNNKITPYPLKNKWKQSIENISCISRIDKNSYAIGTTTGGCFIVDNRGTILQQLNKESGLSNSSVISIYCDKSRNIWIGLDNGLDFIAFDNAVKLINPPNLHHGAGYSSAVFNNRLYLALSNGVYSTAISSSENISKAAAEFTPVANFSGQSWGLSVVNNQLLLGSHEGFYSIKDNTANPVHRGTGFWTFSSYYYMGDQLRIVAGNYNGISLYKNENNTIEWLNHIPSYNESSRFVIVDKNNIIWSSHPYRGVYRIDPSPNVNSVKLYSEVNGLPTSINNHVYKIRNRIVVATEMGLFEYNGTKDVFEPSEYFKTIFGAMGIRYLNEDKYGNIWFIHEKDLGVVDFSTVEPKIYYLPELKGKMVSGFEHINPLNDNNVLIGTQEGFYHIDYEKYRKRNVPVFVTIRNIAIQGEADSILYGGYITKQSSTPKISYDENSLHIEYSSPLYEQQESIEYSYYLKGFDGNWSDWSKKTEKDYTNIPEGHYDFMVKARNNLGNESPPATYSFTILPPWYRSLWAYGLYTIIVVTVAFLLYKRLQQKFHHQRQEYLQKQQQLKYLHQLELEQSEKEIVNLKNEKLQSQIDHKNSELASIAMHLVQKGEILAKIKEELVKLNKNAANKEVTNNIKKIVKTISEDDKMNEDWEHFASHFNNVHSDFLVALKEKFPILNAHDLKLCAYLRMNLTSKEIAQLMNISLRGVEISRYRLRKKLQISTETNLFDYLLNIAREAEKK